jgi:hypothetical protein
MQATPLPHILLVFTADREVNFGQPHRVTPFNDVASRSRTEPTTERRCVMAFAADPVQK